MQDTSAWVVTANMGLGHQRATWPLRELADSGIQLFGDNILSSQKERNQWLLFQRSYESLSRVRRLPVFGPFLYNLLEKLQNISPYYPLRDLSTPSLQLKYLYSLVRKGMGSSLCRMLSQKSLPVITSFYAAAMAAEEHTSLPVFCIICDADINRVWVAENPHKSRIVYFAPCGNAMRRLKQYGVPDERIFMTGFPLPEENIGGPDMPILKADLAKRLLRLDPSKRFRTIHGVEAGYYLGEYWKPEDDDNRFTVTYAVGGAGAQAEIAAGVLKSLAPRIREGSLRLNLVAAHRTEVHDYFLKLLDEYSLAGNTNVSIIYDQNKDKYFEAFSQAMRTTDILWTKPSELSFYCGLGIPIIIAPPIGPHEIQNQRWIRDLGAGFHQEEPEYCGEWIMDYLNDGRLAQAAWDGFLYARKMGTYKIREILSTGGMERDYSPLRR
ncbi:MAG: hypothetical protein HGA22_04525 [Clostridiales bacterium]|nr:hypothetical protein [Clostridiales bacterium]